MTGDAFHRTLFRALTVPALAALLLGAAPARALEPFQLVRSMQIVQDRIADGDHAAMPMQAKLLGMIDRSFRESDVRQMKDERNRDALFVYAMSGGNPSTLDLVLARVTAADEQKQVARGIGEYLRGDLASARGTMAAIDPASLPSSYAPFFALIKGSILAGDDPGAALELFDRARLAAPGTLVEEAALRRSLAAAVATDDPARFLRASSQYARRFLRSPYATQFADELVRGIVRLNDRLDYAQIEQTVSEMTPAHQKVVYLRLARTSAIEGLRALSDFASRKAAEFGSEDSDGRDARALLYANLSAVSTDKADDALAVLTAIDRNRLNPRDQQLLDAAIAVATGVVQPSLPRVETTAPRQPAPLPDRKAATEAAPEQAPVPPRANPVAADGRMIDDTIVSATRRKLEDIDRMLAEQ